MSAESRRRLRSDQAPAPGAAARGRRTRCTGAKPDPPFFPGADERNDSADTRPDGRRSQAAIRRPSSGYAFRSIVGDDEPRRDGCGIPAAIRRDLPGEPHLPVEHHERVLDVDELRLELDDEQRARRRVPGKDVDRAALAEGRERDLRRHHPLGHLEELARDRLVHRRVTGTGQAVQLGTLRPQREDEPQVKLPTHRTQGAQLQALEVPALDPRHRGARDLRLVGEVCLAKPALDSHDADRAADGEIIHAGIVTSRTWPRLIPGPGRRPGRAGR
jgi:hypothetical protein